jgi:hypothetical protein
MDQTVKFMKTILLFTLTLWGATAAAQDQQPTAPTKPVVKKKVTKATTRTVSKTVSKPEPTVAQPLTIPAEAVANPDGTYAYTDKAGKQWIYSKTPFGVSKIQNMGSAPSGFTTTPKEQLIQSTDQGDSVKFSRQTPFGTTTWEKKKSELTDEERALYQSQHPDNRQ